MEVVKEYEGKVVLVTGGAGCGVYGLDSKMPFEEHDISISLHTPYQVTKLLGELYTNYFYNLYGLPIVNARFFNVYGPGEVPGRYRNVIPNFFYWAMNRQASPITGDGTETRDWTYVDDIIDGLLAMGIKEEAVGEAINLGSGKEHRVIDLANMVNELTGQTLRKFNQKCCAEGGVKYVERREGCQKTAFIFYQEGEEAIGLQAANRVRKRFEESARMVRRELGEHRGKCRVLVRSLKGRIEEGDTVQASRKLYKAVRKKRRSC